MASQTMAVQTEMATTVRLSEYLKDDKNWGVAILKESEGEESVFSGKFVGKKTENVRSEVRW